jgi:hypothetical protein
MRREPMKVIALNAKITSAMRPKLPDPPGNGIRFLLPVVKKVHQAPDVTEAQVTLLRVENAEIGRKLFQLWNDAIDAGPKS